MKFIKIKEDFINDLKEVHRVLKDNGIIAVDDFFMDKEVQLLIVDKKVSFDGNQASFNNSYFCYKMLPKDIMFVKIPHNNAKGNFQPSRMWLKLNNGEELF